MLTLFPTHDFRLNPRVLYLEKTEFIISIDNTDLPSINNSSTMATLEVAITELPDTTQKKKPKNMTKKELEVEVTYYRAKEKELLESVGSLWKELEVIKVYIEELKKFKNFVIQAFKIAGVNLEKGGFIPI